MNTDRFLFTTLTTYLIAPNTFPEDKSNITKRIVKECGLENNAYQWVYEHNWQGGENELDIVKAWEHQTISQLDEANQLVRIAHELADRCNLDEIEIDDEWIDVWQIKTFFGSYLAEYGLDYEG